MISTQKRRQQNRRLLSQFDDFDQGVITDEAENRGRQSLVGNNGPIDRESTVDSNDGVPETNENKVNVQKLERSLTDRIDRELKNIADTVED